MIMLLLAIIGQVSDVLSTWLVLINGGIEANPLLGSNPNLWLVLLLKLTVIAIIFRLLKDTARTRVLTFGTAIGFGATGWNLYVIQVIT